MACLQISRSGFFSPTVHLRSNTPLRRRTVHLAVRSRLNTENGDSNGDEPPESLFMKELKKRGVTPSSLLEGVGAEEEKDGGGVASAEYEKRVSAQREVSMALNSEGIEGLIPRAKLLLTLGGTFFLGFWPLILITISAFAAVYLYSGPSFVHDGSKNIHTPPYIDPYELLEDERIAQLAPNVK